MKALSLTIQKIWPMYMLKFLQTDRQTNRPAKNYMPPMYQCRGKNIQPNPNCKHLQIPINSSPLNKILDRARLKAFADSNLNIAKITISVFDRVENTVGKGENAVFFKAFSLGSSKVRIMW